MARTDAQPSRAARGLMVLGNDCVHKVMTFLAVVDARRGVGSASKSLRTTAMSTTLSRTRFCEPYTLRGDKHGVVHAMATACGTRQWATSRITLGGVDPHPSVDARAPPSALSIAIDRKLDDHHSKAHDDCFMHGLVDPILDGERDHILSTNAECGLDPGSLVAYTLPFKLALSQFRFAFGCCRARCFNSWVFEAFDSEQDGWRVLYDSEGVSPWLDVGGCEFGPYKLFQVHSPFASSRFRIRQTHPHSEEEFNPCMHIRGLELFGTILPPWRID